MNDLEHDALEDDQNITIVELPEAGAHGVYSAATPYFGGQTFTRPRLILALRSGTIVGLVVLLLLVLPNNFLYTIGKSALDGILPPPVTRAPLSPGANLIYIGADIPWTTVVLDGHPLRLPAATVAPPLQLTPGPHIIVWAATPFRASSCVITVPALANDSCTSEIVAQTPAEWPQLRLVLLREPLSAMFPGTEENLVQSVRTALQKFQFSTIVQPGERYISPHGTLIASEPLRATLHLRWDFVEVGENEPVCQPDARFTLTASCTFGQQDCIQLCAVQPWQFAQPLDSASVWYALVVVHAFWDFSALDGRIIEHDQPVSPGSGGASDHLLLLQITQGGSNWRVKALFGPDTTRVINAEGTLVANDPACFGVQDVIPLDTQGSSEIRYISGDNPAAGCLVVTASHRAATGPDVNFYLYRFGVPLLIRGSVVAYRYYLPMMHANDYERRVATQLSTFPGQVIHTPTRGI